MEIRCRMLAIEFGYKENGTIAFKARFANIGKRRTIQVASLFPFSYILPYFGCSIMSEMSWPSVDIPKLQSFNYT